MSPWAPGRAEGRGWAAAHLTLGPPFPPAETTPGGRVGVPCAPVKSLVSWPEPSTVSQRLPLGGGEGDKPGRHAL